MAKTSTFQIPLVHYVTETLWFSRMDWIAIVLVDIDAE